MARKPEIPTALFERKPSRQETKADATTTAARSIVHAEQKAQDNKTAKLKALRLAREASEPAPEVAAKPKRPARKKAAAKSAS